MVEKFPIYVLKEKGIALLELPIQKRKEHFFVEEEIQYESCMYHYILLHMF